MTAAASSMQKNQYTDVARQAVAPRSDGRATKTPSWTSIVEAFHKEGNGDREMLLALLSAKAKEDERLAALDILKAEQLRAYTAHITVHGPLFAQHHAAAAAPSSSAAPPFAASSTLNAPSGRRSRGDSHSTRRSPSLSANGNSSPEPEAVKTPEEDRSSRFEAFHDSAKPIVHELPPLKRKRSGDMDDNAIPTRYTVYGGSTRPAGAPTSHAQLKRISPYGAPRMLPGISSLVSAASHAHQAEQEQQKQHAQQARRASAGQSYRPSSDVRAQQPVSPKSLRNLLNDEGRMYNARVATSDVRSSSSEGDDEERII